MSNTNSNKRPSIKVGQKPELDKTGDPVTPNSSKGKVSFADE